MKPAIGFREHKAAKNFYFQTENQSLHEIELLIKLNAAASVGHEIVDLHYYRGYFGPYIRLGNSLASQVQDGKNRGTAATSIRSPLVEHLG